jgi:hypothetical protein
LDGVGHEAEDNAAGIVALPRRRREVVYRIHGHAQHAALLCQPRVLLPDLRSQLADPVAISSAPSTLGWFVMSATGNHVMCVEREEQPQIRRRSHILRR